LLLLLLLLLCFLFSSKALYVNSVSLGWAGFLSYVTHRGLFKTEKAESIETIEEPKKTTSA